MRRALALLPIAAIVACSGGHSTPTPTPAPASTPSAVEYATIACRHFTPGGPQLDETTQFLSNAKQAAARDARWEPVQRAAQAYFDVIGSTNLLQLTTAIQNADDACKSVP